MRTGCLYLTPHYLLFDNYLKILSESKQIIPLQEIVSVNKVNPEKKEISAKISTDESESNHSRKRFRFGNYYEKWRETHI